MAAILRNAIVVAMGAAALGGPEALRLLLVFAGRSPLVDIAIAVFVIAAVTAPALGTMLLARFFRKAHTAASAGGGATGAAAGDPFAKMTLVVSMAVAFVVSASLLILPVFQSGDLGLLCFLLAFAVSAFVVRASAARLCCFFRKVHSASGAAAAAPATERSTKKTLLVSLAALCLLLVPCVAFGCLDAWAQRLFPAFALKNPLVHTPTGVATATATVVGTTLLALYSRKAQNAAAAAAAAAPATAAERFPSGASA